MRAGLLLHFRSPGALLGKIHIVKVMAITTFQGIVSLETLPLILRQAAALFLKFFPGINGAKDRPPKLL